MLYGANGYTGRLIAQEAVARGLRPILAGRNREQIEAMASELSLDYRVFELPALRDNLDSVSALLLAAGPFVHTSAMAANACIEAGIHYLDITGEIAVFEGLHAQHERAKAAGSVLLPGVGFDVVPSDCLAASLAAALPDAVELELAFCAGGFSKGTAKTMLHGIALGGAIRKEGKIARVPLASQVKEVAFFDKTRSCMSIPWGDVSTAYYSTKIPTIRVFARANRSTVLRMKFARYLAPLLATKLMQKQISRLIDAKVKGPSESARQSQKTQLWGQVRNASGKEVTATLTTPEGYTLTAKTAVTSVERIATVAPGFKTPSLAFGAGYIEQFAGCTLRQGA